MDILITFLASLGLLVLLILILHRSQLTAAQSSADRRLPLPPLRTHKDSQSRTAETSAKNMRHQSTAQDFAVPLANAAIPDSAPAANPAPFTETSEDTAESMRGWADQVAALKKADDLNGALEVCRQVYPLWSAYQQASLIYRAMVKNRLGAGESCETELQELYHLAAVAATLHDRAKGLPNLSLAQLKQLDLDRVMQLPMPYAQIGYLQLRLIKKSDIRLMLELWGKPEAHVSPRQFHEQFWFDTARELVSGATG